MYRILVAILVGAVTLLGFDLYYCLRKAEDKSLKEYFVRAGNWKNIIILFVCAVGMCLIYWRAGYFELAYINKIRNELVFAWLFFLALIDFKEQIIPRVLTHVGLGWWLVFVLLAVLVGKAGIVSILLFSLGGLLLGGGLFVICRILSKGGVGMGDIRMFSVIGLLYGLNYTFSILLFTIVFMSVFGIVAMLCKKKSLNSQLCMAPFALVAFFLCCMLGV